MSLSDKEYNELENIKNDLKFQLSFEDIDWDYFIETALRAKYIEDIKLKESN